MGIKYLHTMVRVKDLDKSIEFYKLLGLKEAHATPRRTKIGRAADADLTEEDLTANEQ